MDQHGQALGALISTVEPMKLRIARTLALGGALASVTAVAAYSSASGSAPDPAAASSSTVAGTTPGSGSTASSAASSTPNSAPVTVSSVAVPGSPSQFSFLAGDAATLVLDTAGGTLRIVTFVPNPGWFTVRLEQSSAAALDVQLESASGQVQFSADLVNGGIVTDLLATAGPATSAPGNSTPGNSTPGNSTPGNTTPGGDDNGGDDNGGDDNGGGGDDNGGDDNSGPGGGGSDD